jgi:IS5 family transposase
MVTVRIQRNSREENRRIKAGEETEEWYEPERRQKDTDARWTNKHGKSYFGYEKRIDVDAEHKLIRDYEATAAKVHDSQVFENIINPDASSGLGDPQV